MSLPAELRQRLSLPIIAAPMFLVSGPKLVIAACRAGVVGSFPTVNARGAEELEAWLSEIDAALACGDGAGGDGAGGGPAPYAANLIVHRTSSRLPGDLELVVKHRVALVIASVGHPGPVLGPVHDYGGRVLCDVASMRHVEKALDAGVDGLVLLCAGAGGQTGWLNPFAFVRAVRALYDGPVILAGGIADGISVRAAEALGADLADLGTRFIATAESLASAGYRRMLVESGVDDIVLTPAFTGLPTNMLRPSIEAAGLDADALPARGKREVEKDIDAGAQSKTRWRDIWSAGHGVDAVTSVLPVSELVAELKAEYERAGAGDPLARA